LELKARGEPNYKTYDLTLKLVDKPGLPPPTVRTNTVAAKEIKVRALDDEEGLDDAEKDDGAPAPDVTLDEAKRILQDLIELVDKAKTLAGPAK
jgi:hypothetical protein